MAEGSWRWDQMHNPTPLSPLSIEMSDLVLESLVREAGATHDQPLADPLPQHLDLVTGPGDARRLSQCTGLRLEALQDEGGIAAARRLGLIEGLAESRLAGAVGQYEVYYRPGAVRNNSILSHSAARKRSCGTRMSWLPSTLMKSNGASPTDDACSATHVNTSGCVTSCHDASRARTRSKIDQRIARWFSPRRVFRPNWTTS